MGGYTFKLVDDQSKSYAPTSTTYSGGNNNNDFGNYKFEGNYYASAPGGKISSIEVTVSILKGLYGTCFTRNGDDVYLNGSVSPNGTVRGEYRRGSTRGTFTGKTKANALVLTLKGTISTTVVASKTEGAAPPFLAGKFAHLSTGESIGDVFFYSRHAYNSFNEKNEPYRYRKISANRALVTVGGTRILLNFEVGKNAGEGTYTASGSDGIFSGYFGLFDLSRD